MLQRKYNKKRSEVAKVNKRILLLITLAGDNNCNQSSGVFRNKRDELIAIHQYLRQFAIACP
jgi:hypothetical protein